MPDSVSNPQPAPNPLVKAAVRRALNGAMLTSAVASTCGVGTAQAQQGPTTAPEAGPELQEVVVTGSRIRRIDTETANPVLVIDQQQIQASGITQVGDLLQRIPSISGQATNPNVNNGGGFAESCVELRGLDCKRTLILLDGHRVGFVGTTSDATDVNQIPFNMIDHVEVLKEGAGAIYGSDAIGGVVNFITRKDYQGVELTGDLGETTHADGKHGTFGILFGQTSDKGSIQVGGNYFKQDEVFAGRRDYSKYALYLYGGSTGVTKGGSTRVPTGRIFDNPLNLIGANGKSCSSVTRIASTNGSTLQDYRCFNSPADDFNYQPINLLTTPVERSSFFGKGNYHINDFVEAYSSVTFTHSHSGFQEAPLPFDSLNDNITLSKNSIYNPFGIDFGGNSGANPDFTLRTFLFGPRESDSTEDGSDFNGGVKGKIFSSSWTWDANVTYSRLQEHENVSGYYFGSKLNAAVGPSFLDGGVPTCGTPTAIVSNCTPVNLFDQYSNSAAALSGLSANYNDDYVYTYKAIDLDFTGNVWTLPAGELQAAVGFEYNDRRGNFAPDQIVVAAPPLYLSCGLSQETCTGPAIGTYNSKQEYLELLVPILKDLPGVQSLNIDAGVRHNDYSLFGKSTKADFKVEYHPIKDILVRGTFSQVLRVPTINDIAASPASSSTTFNDPCTDLTQAKVNANPNLALACEGVPRNGTFKEPNGQIQSLNESNPNLKPETGLVKTAGFVYEPSYVSGLSLEVDYWTYHIEGLITTLNSNYSIAQCVATGNPTYCSLVTRYGANTGTNAGVVQAFLNPAENLGTLDTSGVDIGVKYAIKNTPVGAFNFELDWTHTNNYTNNLGGGTAPQEIAGTYSQQFGNYAKNRALALIGWNWLGADALITERYIGSLVITNPSVTGLTATGAPYPPYPIGSVLYTDVTLGYTFPTQTHLMVGIRNLSDKQPPIFYQNNVTNANTDVNTYDTLGRQWWVGFVQKF
jgi:outer membrane receptor protein involved in Fe transport